MLRPEGSIDKKFRNLFLEFLGIFQTAFPDYQRLPAQFAQFPLRNLVSSFVSIDFLDPIFRVGFRLPGAAGAVGQTVGQVARIKGCRVVGIAGGKAKCDFVVNELKFDACIDYKSGNVQDGARAVRDGLKQHCPKGVDVYFDNVGGDILDAVLTRINRGARIVVCGAVSQYNNTTPVKGPSNYMMLLVARARMQGMVVFDYADRFPAAIKDIAQWMKEGKFVSREDVVPGIENFPETMNKLFSGGNFGKLILKVADQ